MTTALANSPMSSILAGPVGSLDSYIHAANNVPVLSAEREHELATQLHEHADMSAAREMVLSQLRFVVHIARGYNGYGLPMADLIQEGNVGLMKAVKRFNPEVGVRLVTYAVHWIRAEIHEYVLRNWRMVKVATTKAQRKLFFNLRKKKKHLGWLSADETVAIANDLGVSAKDVTEMEKRLGASDLTYDAPTDGDDDVSYAPVHYLPKTNADPAELIEREDHNDDQSSRLELALEQLDTRSREILQARWLNDAKLTLHELATQYSVSAERIRQIEAAAIKKLQIAMG
ncbi:MAG: RNA polymerase sigma factor RpoH [Gammaproteobacteria bacterium]|nr:RNA polymerase sigma factor RpoH [Gammaproteobacteria bacterium]